VRATLTSIRSRRTVARGMWGVVRASVWAVTVGGTPALCDRDQGNSVDSQVTSDSDSVLDTASSDTDTITS
jgi:hypothetical protein